MHPDTDDKDGREIMRAVPISAGRKKKMRKREKIAKGYKEKERNEPCEEVEIEAEKKRKEQNAKGDGEQG